MTQVQSEHFDRLFISPVTEFVPDLAFDRRLKKPLPRIRAGIFDNIGEYAFFFDKFRINGVQTRRVGTIYPDFQHLLVLAAKDRENTVARDLLNRLRIIIIVSVYGIFFRISRRNDRSETVNDIF